MIRAFSFSRSIAEFRRTVIGKNAQIALLDQIATAVLWLILLAIFARAVGVQAFGLALLAVTIGEMYAIISDFGVGYMTIRQTAISATSPADLSALLLLKLLLVLPTALLVSTVTYLIYPPSYLPLIGITILTYTTKTFRTFFTSLFSGAEHFGHTAISNVLYSASALVVLLIFTTVGSKSPLILLWALLAGNLLSAIPTVFIAIRLYHFRWEAPPLSRVVDLARSTVPYGLFFVGAFLYFQTDTFLLSILIGPDAVGIYQAAFRFIHATEILPGVVSAALYPTLARLATNEFPRSRRILGTSSRLTLLFGLPLGVAVALLAPMIVRHTVGDDFRAAVRVLQILSLMIPFRAVAYVLGVSLTSMGQQSRRVAAVYLVAAASLLMNVLLVPRFSYYGAAIAAVITSMILALLYARSLSGLTEATIVRDGVIHHTIGKRT